MSAFFSLGFFLSFLGNILGRFDKARTTILDQKPAVVYALLFLLVVVPLPRYHTNV